jgi:hypothetical protein
MNIVAIVLFAVGFPSALRLSDDPAELLARTIVEKAVVAKGARENLLRFPAWRFKYKETFRSGDKEIIETGEAIEQPGSRRARYESAGGPTVIIDGDQGWIQQIDGKVVVLDKAHLADFESYLKGKDGLFRVLPLLQEDWTLRHEGEKALDGKANDVVRVQWKDRWSALTYWDRATHLLTQAEYEHKRLIESDPKLRKTTKRKLMFGDYQAVGKITFHTKITTYIAERPAGEVNLSAIELLMTVPDHLVAAPKRPK